MGALGSVVQATETATAAYAQGVWTRFDTTAEPAIVAVATVSLVVTGYLMFTGQLRLTTAQFFPRLLRWIVILVLLLNMPLLFPWAFELVTDVPADVALFLLAGGPITTEADVIDLIEAVMTAGISAAGTIWEEASWYDLSLHVLSGLLLLTGLVLAILAAVLLMVSKLGVGILLAVAPFFLILRLFDIGKGLFEGWLRQLLTFALVPVFVYSLIALNFGILESAHTQLTAALPTATPPGPGVNFTTAVPYILVALVNMILLTQVMGWAGGVGGGIALAVSAGGVLAGVATASRISTATAAATQKAAAVGAPLATAAGRAAMRTFGRGGP